MASDTSDTPDAILGQEFLTWLWFQSDVAPSFFRTDDGQPFQVSMEKRVTVTGGEGSERETTSVSANIDSSLSEARLGLHRGKKVTRALIHLTKDDFGFDVSVKAADFSLNSLKTPKIRIRSFWKKSFSSKLPLPSWTASTASSSASGSTGTNGIRRRTKCSSG